MKRALFVLAVVTALTWASAARAENVTVGVYVNSFGRLDMATKSYSADFYIWMKARKAFDADFEFMNGSGAMDKSMDCATEKWWRVKANLDIPVDLRRYPFDTQKLRIVIEDKRATIDAVRYVPDDNGTGLEPGIAFAGFDISGIGPVVTEHQYPWGETYSQYVFTVDIKRTVFNAFLKTFLPVIFIMLVVMSSFILGPDKAATRLAAVSSGLVTCVMFHLSISSSNPPVGYLTFADKFMVLTYFILLASFFLNARLMVLLDKRKDTAAAEKLHKATEGVVFTVVPLLYVALFLVLLF